MLTPGFKFGRRFWVGLGVATLAIVGSGLMLRAKRVTPGPIAPGPRPFVQLAGVGSTETSRILQERAELMDPTPLFFPTEWNYGQRPVVLDRQRGPGQVFGSFDAKLTVPVQGLSPYGAHAVQGPERLADVLVQGNEAPFAGLGHIDSAKASLPVRSGFLEIHGLDNIQYSVGKQLTGFELPKTDFTPLEFLVIVGAGGLVADPILTSGSGWDEVDSFFRTYLVKSYRLGERLPPGRYRIVIGT